MKKYRSAKLMILPLSLLKIFLEKNIFSKLVVIIGNLLILFLLILLSLKSLNWLLFVANWTVVTRNIHLYIFGSYPVIHQWRPLIWVGLIISTTLLTLFKQNFSLIRKYIPFLWISIIPIGLVLHAGGLGLHPVPTRYWGGLSLTILLTICSGGIALPLGIILALGRRSKMAIVNVPCRLYVELIRAIPLIAVLFFGQLLIPLFLPIDIELNRVFRAIIAFTLFSAAYIAEDIRSGLQSIPKTQKEAANALGLSNRQVMQFILLPQGLRIALPALTNQAIGLLQNTSLMAILGLVELLGITRSLLANPEFIGRYLEAYIWLGFVYWFVCTGMAIISSRLEKELTQGNSDKINI